MAFKIGLFPVTVGFECTGGILRVAASVHRGWQERLLKVHEKEVSAKAAMSDGTIRSPLECAQILSESLQANKVAGSGHLVLLLPPEKVYTHLFIIPKVPLAEVASAIRPEVERYIPEEIRELTILPWVLGETPQGLEVGVAAVRTDFLAGYLETAQISDIHVERVTTAPAAIASFTHARKEVKTFLLLSLPSSNAKRATVTLFYKGWPIDEVVLQPPAADADIVESVAQIIEQYKSRNWPVERIVILGTTAGEETMRGQLQSRLPSHPSFERALPWLKDRNEEWGGLQAACLADPKMLHLSFVEQKNTEKKRLYIWLGLLGAIVLAAAVYFLFLR